jgi:hypothetical protein
MKILITFIILNFYTEVPFKTFLVLKIFVLQTQRRKSFFKQNAFKFAKKSIAFGNCSALKSRINGKQLAPLR